VFTQVMEEQTEKDDAGWFEFEKSREYHSHDPRPFEFT